MQLVVMHSEIDGKVRRKVMAQLKSRLLIPHADSQIPDLRFDLYWQILRYAEPDVVVAI